MPQNRYNFIDSATMILLFIHLYLPLIERKVGVLCKLTSRPMDTTYCQVPGENSSEHFQSKGNQKSG